MNKYNFGIVGLGVMDRNLLLNMADNGFAVTGLDLEPEKAESLQSEAQDGQDIKTTTHAEEFMELLQQPRSIMLLVPEGKPVDAAIASLVPFFDEDDIISYTMGLI